MTELHRAAQQALAKNRRTLLPHHPHGFGGGQYRFSSIELEARVGNRRVDCLAIGEGLMGTFYEKIKLAIEIRVTSPVSSDKLAELRGHDLNAVVEVDLRRHSKKEWDLRSLEFAVCESAMDIKWLYSDQDEAFAKIEQEHQAEAEEGWRRHLIELVDRYEEGSFSGTYEVDAMNCWKCEAATPIFTWAAGQWDMKDSPPPDPKPRTLKLTWSRTIGTRYWANRCGKCDSLQGDFYIGIQTQLYHQDWHDQWHKNRDGDGNDTLTNWVGDMDGRQ